MAAPVKVARHEPFLLNLRQHTPEPSEIFQNLPELASGTYTVLHRNSPEPSGTCLRNLHHFTKELSGTFRNPPPEPTPTHSGTLRNLPEPSSGTGSCDPHRHTPELIWAEDPISSRCWGTITKITIRIPQKQKCEWTSLGDPNSEIYPWHLAMTAMISAPTPLPPGVPIPVEKALSTCQRAWWCPEVLENGKLIFNH